MANHMLEHCGSEMNGRPTDRKLARRPIPEAQCTALLLVAAADLSYQEAAEICGCAIGTIKSRVSRAHTRLVEMLCLPMRSYPCVDSYEFPLTQNP